MKYRFSCWGWHSMDSCDYFVRTSLRVGFLLEIAVAAFDVCRFRDQSLRLRLKIQRKRTWFAGRRK